MWDLSQKSEVFDLTSKSQLLWYAMLVKECTNLIWSCQQESICTVFWRTPPMTLWMALELLSRKCCLWSSERTLESVKLKKEGLMGANWAIGSKRLEATNTLTYVDNVDLGCQGRWDLHQRWWLTVSLSDSVWFFTVSQTRPPPCRRLSHSARHKSIPEEPYTWLSQLTVPSAAHTLG